MKLDYFFDTNVIVGYSIPNDYWNNRAKKAFKKEGCHDRLVAGRKANTMSRA